MEWDWKPFRPPARDPIIVKIDEWHRRQNGGYVQETPHLLDNDHPAFHSMPPMKFTREDIRKMYMAFTGKEPPTSFAEWKKLFTDKGLPVPKYAQDYMDQHPELE